jgi:hypothetical protein
VITQTFEAHNNLKFTLRQHGHRGSFSRPARQKMTTTTARVAKFFPRGVDTFLREGALNADREV